MEIADAEDLGRRFAERVAAKDVVGVQQLLDATVDFRAMTPSRFWQAEDPAGVTDIVFGHWFEPSDRIEALDTVTSDLVVDRCHLSYRLQIRNDDGLHLVEQQAYFMIDNNSPERISWMRVMCSGFRPIEG